MVVVVGGHSCYHLTFFNTRFDVTFLHPVHDSFCPVGVFDTFS